MLSHSTSVAGRPSSSHFATFRLMESVGALSDPTRGSSNLLSLPAPYCWDDEEEESLGLKGIKPKSSPIPRRRSSVSDDEDFLPPPSSSRRVSFADAFGLSLVSVKQFDVWAVTVPPDPLEKELRSDAKEYYMVPLFVLPQNIEELDLRVHQQMIELENLELLPGTTTLRGTVRVLNLSYDKMVYVRTSLDSWKSHFDLLAEFVPGSHNGTMDSFSFKLTLVPPFGEEGARVDFCLRYETSLGTFWSNNKGQNYAAFCYEKTKGKTQNEIENRRKSCLKATSSSASDMTAANNEEFSGNLPSVNLCSSASDMTAANNEEFSDIIVNSGPATGSESQNTSEELLKENKELLEEMSRNRSERNRRKAARLAKVKEHFAQRREETQGTKMEEGEVAEESSVRESVSVLEKEPHGLSQQTTAGPPTCNQIPSPSPAESLGSSEHCEDSTHMFRPQAVEQHMRDAAIQSETNPSTCQSTDTDDFSHQTVSDLQPPPRRQRSDLSTCKDVERAWKNFELDAKQKIKSVSQSPKPDEDGKPALGEKVSLKTSNPALQMFSHSFAFGTIVAPLYHQVFKNMETERKDFIQRAFQVDRTFRELEDESLKAVRPENDEAFTSQSTETGPEPLVSTEQTECDTTAAQNSMRPPTKPSSDLNASKQIQKTEACHGYQNDYTSDIIKYSKDNTFNKVTQNEENFTNTQSNITVENITSQTQIYPCNQFSKEPQTFCNVLFEKPQHDFSPFPTQTQQQIPSILYEGPAEPDSQDVAPENSNCTSQTLPEEPEMDQSPSISTDSSGDKLEPDYSDLRANNEKPKLTEPHLEPENTQMNTSNASENCQINETKEQIIVTFSSQISRPESFRIVDGANEFDEESKNVQKEELEEQFTCHILERLDEEEKVMQMEKQEVEEDQRKQEQESTEEQEVKEQRINNIEDELKYIDDEEDIDVNAVEPENTVNQESAEKMTEEKELVAISTTLESLPQHDNELSGGEDTSSGGEETGEETCSSWQEPTQNRSAALSEGLQAKKVWKHLEFIDNEDCEREKLQNQEKPDRENIMQENQEGQSKDSTNMDVEKDVEDNTSTESLVDDEMELYLTCLRKSQQSVFREGVTNGSYTKRPSLCKGRPLAMPSISESVDEDQPNGNPEDTNAEGTTELLGEGNEHVIGRNVLWWKEFLSYENMSRVVGYSVLVVVFFIVAYYYDFVACLALYLLTVYWLFRQREEEPMRSSWRKE